MTAQNTRTKHKAIQIAVIPFTYISHFQHVARTKVQEIRAFVTQFIKFIQFDFKVQTYNSHKITKFITLSWVLLTNTYKNRKIITFPFKLSKNSIFFSIESPRDFALSPAQKQYQNSTLLQGDELIQINIEETTKKI